jgi:epoxyqueuosine reductase
MHDPDPVTDSSARALRRTLDDWAAELGFQQVGVTDTNVNVHAERLAGWLERGLHGEMDWLRRHLDLRTEPARLFPGTIRVISVRMDCLPDGAAPLEVLDAPDRAYIARYALGRDYHKVLRGRLSRLATRLESAVPGSRYRALVDSAPVLERGLAEKAGLGWIGKNTMLLNRQAGSWFMLGEIYPDLPLPVDPPTTSQHCGSCRACLDICPTQAFVGPHELDARRCISYLTIELRGSIPEALRPLMGNRVFGCDDCQLVCPWNRYAQLSCEEDFAPRHGLDSARLVDLFRWSEEQFLERTAGSALRRTGYVGWLRNLAVGLGNAPYDSEIVAALETRLEHTSEIVREHVQWALAQQRGKAPEGS